MLPRRPPPRGGRARAPGARCDDEGLVKKEDSSEKEGGVEDKGFEAVGLVGTIPVVFQQNMKLKVPKKSLWRKILKRGPSKKAIAAADAENVDGPKVQKLKTMAIVNQPLSEVAAQAGQMIKYKCKKGECGTCEVRIDGQWVRTCVAKVPNIEEGKQLDVFVRESMAEIKMSSSFFSRSSFISGFQNNFWGMVGFFTQAFKGKKNFEDRISAEDELKAKVAARKAAKAAAEKKN
eukprot:CAMPEP_0206229010 /NCGR_PEP_ID=MMETSP0047_2-20121206/9468_1 /ASSEMBLY_ACC=CAM_ASM_000192 /TAXON_ID=195065 /ORGANISM="Chroomonas mesostigmatica_cf, Strain CCMP1168" /LENGTH=233 /DNA_ID=CAMNT_0053652279 /DNA_START=316 /DNA_END=1018 /DNA_ORIENTATION=+